MLVHVQCLYIQHCAVLEIQPLSTFPSNECIGIEMVRNLFKLSQLGAWSRCFHLIIDYFGESLLLPSKQHGNSGNPPYHIVLNISGSNFHKFQGALTYIIGCKYCSYCTPATCQLNCEGYTSNINAMKMAQIGK